MAYTVKGLAKISGVSVRTLHWYDKVGLLKPFTKGLNNYRYYEEEQLLRLQQILFFKGLGFSLSTIQKLLSQNDFDNARTLKAHRKILEDEIIRKKKLMATIDKTIQYLEGKQRMRENDLYKGFDDKIAKKYKSFVVKFRGSSSEKVISNNKQKPLSEEDKLRIAKESVEIFNKITELMKSSYPYESTEIQQIISKHAELLSSYHHVNKPLYLGYADAYSGLSEFRDYFSTYDEKFAEFLSKAMRCYANKNL